MEGDCRGSDNDKYDNDEGSRYCQADCVQAMAR